MTHFYAKEPITKRSLLKIIKYVDGDGIFLEDIISKNQFEVRFLGIDAPEMSYCKKIRKDEKELHMPAALLSDLGFKSLKFLKQNVQLGDRCSLIQETKNLQDKYGRQLGYLVLDDDTILNEIMVKEGYAKPYNDVYCEMLPEYQRLSLEAKAKKKGLYSLVSNF
jgi:micrococcal nuclease